MESSPEMQALIRLTTEERTLMRTPAKGLNIARKRQEKEPPKPLDDFFTQGYPQFKFVANASPESQWKRLALSEQWSPDSHDYASARERFEAAYDDQFNTAIDGFFNHFLDFDYNPRAEAKAEFERLRQSKRWFDEGQKNLKYWYQWTEYREARKKFFAAFQDDFSCFFGSGDDVRDWVFLCDVLRVKPTPRTIEHCKSALESYYVNIWDLYDHVRSKLKEPLLCHDTVAELSVYSRDNNKLYPLESAKTTCMKFLLRRFVGVPGMRWDDWGRKLVTEREFQQSKAEMLKLKELVRSQTGGRARGLMWS